MTRIITDTDFGSTTRQKIFTYAVLALSAIFIMRLGWLQIVQGGAYRSKAETQAIKKIKIEPYRGIMIDRNGIAIVQNVAGFTVTITPYEFTEEARVRLAHILNVPDSLIKVEVERESARNRFSPFKLSVGRDVETAVLTAIEEQREFLPGVDVIVDPKRHYAFEGNAAHLLGYTREVDERDLLNLGNTYEPGDITGKTGLERAYESDIRGQRGFEFVAVNNKGQRVARFNDGRSDISAQEGFDLYLGLDVELQSLAEQLMDKNSYRGGIVALDPSNGEILCFVSKPDFNLRELTGRTTRSYFNKIFVDPEKPLFNRASMPSYPPGSTFKMLVAIACLEEGLITPTSKLVCTGAYHYGNRSMACHGAHGAISVDRAIQASCNSFFAQCGVMLGADGFKKYGSLFGFGQKTMVDITEESIGLIPSREYMDRRLGKRGWTKYAAANWGIGQGEVSVTPLQMAQYTAALANGGTLYQPHAVRSIYNRVLGKNQNVAYGKVDLHIKPEHMEVIRRGLFMVVNVPGGTAGMVKLPDISICGKTGTAQNPHGKDHSWFVAFAPYEDPKIAICVMVENVGYGATHAAPIAQKLIQFYLKRTLPDGVEMATDSARVPLPDTPSTEITEPDSIIGPFVADSK